VVAALAAAQCEAGTFVLHQDNSSAIFVQGTLNNTVWGGHVNGTEM